ncbi:hypothetical protein Rsub_06800 [Raphidocelis subcapitata]|uniref:O-fucosyltransferase family protein n=1 Tax=Raphidocelis subcapitata TaxID=307507 RepID=A0A2V0P958_9CHLO|nr:hypothetical protein Rsub_06800 [Raphidocelis subcapitata]|eukprot:GBF93697.1 hypothetical protein Rsub_06800 [Raphidocelis subcapitata]
MRERAFLGSDAKPNRRRPPRSSRGALPPAIAAVALVAAAAAAVAVWAAAARLRGWHGAGGAAAPAAPMACADRPLRGKGYEVSFGLCNQVNGHVNALAFAGYEVSFGLCNQVNGHVNALAFALAGGLDGVVLPPAWSRPSLNHSVWQDVWNKTTPVATLLDVAEMRRRLEPAGLEVLQLTEWGGLGARHGCAFGELPFLPLESFGHALWRLRVELDATRSKFAADYEPCYYIQQIRQFWAHDFTSGHNFPHLAARSLAFNSTVEALAEEVAAAIGGAFNGAHMRIEIDMGLKAEQAMPEYIAEMRRLGFNASAPLYAASGLLTYNDTRAFRRMEAALKTAGVCSRVLAKEFLISPDRLAGLHSEQLALVDLLVLTRSARLVGHKASTFSYFARDLRALRGGGDWGTAGLLPGGDTWETGTVIRPASD